MTNASPCPRLFWWLPDTSVCSFSSTRLTELLLNLSAPHLSLQDHQTFPGVETLHTGFISPGIHSPLHPVQVILLYLVNIVRPLGRLKKYFVIIFQWFLVGECVQKLPNLLLAEAEVHPSYFWSQLLVFISLKYPLLFGQFYFLFFSCESILIIGNEMFIYLFWWLAL